MIENEKSSTSLFQGTLAVRYSFEGLNCIVHVGRKPTLRKEMKMKMRRYRVYLYINVNVYAMKDVKINDESIER